MDIRTVNDILNKITAKMERVHRRIGVAAPYTTGSDGKYDDITDAYPEP